MSRRPRFALADAVLLSAAVLSLAAVARAEVSSPISVDQHGDFVLIGNTLAHNCAGDVPAPVVGLVGDCGDNVEDNGADVFWGRDPDGIESAVANVDVDVEDASSVAVLQLPPGATVTHARLYWSALAGSGDQTLSTLSRDGEFSAEVTALSSTTQIDPPDEFYQSTADVTALVQEHGAGAYRLGGVDALDPVDLSNNVYYAGWWMVVLYERAADPLRNLSVFEGFELVSADSDQSVQLSGFSVPTGAFDAHLGVVAFEGDESLSGDELRFGPGLPLEVADRLEGTDNFFNSSRRLNGAPLSFAGDLPQLTGDANSQSGLDLDVVDVTDRVVAGQTSAELHALTGGDTDLYLLSGFVTSISTFSPELTESTKTVEDLNGGALRPGDELEYTILVTNTGSDAAVVASEIIASGRSSGLLTTRSVPASRVPMASANSRPRASARRNGPFFTETMILSPSLGAWK
jgi:hypothetical protein